MRLVRIAVAATLSVAVALVIWQRILPRYECSAQKKKAELWLESASEAGSFDRRISVARGVIPRLMHCVENDPSDYEALFLLGVARYEAGQREAAMQAFSVALALNERPEIYTSLGIMQLETGQATAARENLLRAASFNIAFSGEVEASLAAELYAEVEKRRERLRARIGK
jgi:tetratricopeptide (TPR) repeat protein